MLSLGLKNKTGKMKSILLLGNKTHRSILKAD